MLAVSTQARGTPRTFSSHRCGTKTSRLRPGLTQHGWRHAALFSKPLRLPSSTRKVHAVSANAAAAGSPFDPYVLNPPVEQTLPKARNPFQAWSRFWNLGPEVQRAGSSSSQSAWTLFNRVLSVAKLPVPLLFISIVFMVAAAAAELTIPHFVSASIFTATSETTRALFEDNVRFLAVAAASYAVFAGLRGYCFSLLNIQLVQRLRLALFNSLVKQPVAFFDGTEVGQLTSRLGNDCQAVVRCLATNLNVALRNSLQCIGGAIYLYSLSKELAAACLGVTVLLWAVALRHGGFTRKAQRRYQDRLAASNQVAEETFSLSRLVRTFGTEEYEGKRYDASLGHLRRISVRQAVAYLFYLIANCFLYNATKVVTVAGGGAMVLAGKMTAQQLTQFVLYVEFVTYASLSVCDQWGAIMEAVGASERVIDYLEQPPAAQLAPGRKLDDFSGIVELAGVSFAYEGRSDVKAVEGITLRLTPGKLIALVGLSGSGKSTLVSLLQRQYDPTSGTIYMDGVPLNELDAEWFRSQIGVVSQDTRLFSTTVAANIAYGCANVTGQDEIVEAAKLANAHDFISALPNGYNTIVSDKLLSAGQRQRIALARALIRNPKLLILDEATSALDAESEAAVQDALDRAMRTPDRTVIVIAHRLSTVQSANMTVVLDGGKLAEVGTHRSLINDDGIYAKLVRRQGLQEPDMAPTEERSYYKLMHTYDDHTRASLDDDEGKAASVVRQEQFT